MAFMYGGSSYDPNPGNRKNLCELAGTTIPDKGWGDNYRFCKAGTHVNKTGAWGWGAGGGDALCPSEHTWRVSLLWAPLTLVTPRSPYILPISLRAPIRARAGARTHTRPGDVPYAWRVCRGRACE